MTSCDQISPDGSCPVGASIVRSTYMMDAYFTSESGAQHFIECLQKDGKVDPQKSLHPSGMWRVTWWEPRA